MDIIEYARGFMKSIDKVETMNKDYRPDGWETLKPTSKVLHCLNPEACVGSAYEAGASAMLEGLIERGAYMTPEQMKLLEPDRKYPYGYLVFIPEGER